jgi:putative oxidoreductase
MNNTSSTNLMQLLANKLKPVTSSLQTYAAPVLLLAMRLYVARVFFLSGLTKIRDWDTTIALFTDEYKVPLLSPQLAALSGTFGELVFPVLLALGLGGRFAALALFFMNIVAVISYPGLAEPAVKEHFYWGMMLTVLFIFGPGRIALDALLARKSTLFSAIA